METKTPRQDNHYKNVKPCTKIYVFRAGINNHMRPYRFEWCVNAFRTHSGVYTVQHLGGSAAHRAHVMP